MLRTRLTKLLVVLALMAAAASCCSVDANTFTVVMLPDAQNYSQSFPANFHAQTQWIRDNVSKENIVFVTQVGDIVNLGTEAPEQWKVADAAMSRLDGVVPWGVAMGNHDYDDFRAEVRQDSSTFARYFGPKRFAKYSWYGGGTDDGQCSYQFFDGAGRRFMIIHLAFRCNDKALAFAESVLAAHPDVPTIISTHSYLGPAEENSVRSQDSQSLGIAWRSMKEKLIDKHPQVFLVVCGHWPVAFPMYRTDANRAGRKVLALVADFQAYPDGGQGWLVLLRFDTAKAQLNVRAYSPVLHKYFPAPQGNVTLPCRIP